MQFVKVDLFQTVMDVFFIHLEEIKNLINIEFPGVSWQITGSFIT